MRIGMLLLGGLVAGLVINLSGIAVVRFLLGPDYVHSLMSHVPEPVGPATFVRHLGIRFGFGILGVVLFAALRPRFHATAPAAVAAGTFLFLAAYVPLALMLNEIAVLVGWKLWATLAWGLGEAIVAVLLGAMLFVRLGGG